MAHNASTMSPSGDEFLSTDVTLMFNDPTQRFLVALFFCVFSVIGLAGNGLVILAVLRFRKLRTVTNVFVINLAVSDIIGCSLLPIVAVSFFSGHDKLPYPKRLCAMVIGAAYVMFGASVMNLTLIAVNRYVLTIHPKERYLRVYGKRNITLMLLWSWVYVAIVGLAPPIFGVGALGYSSRFGVCDTVSEHQWNPYYTAIRSIMLLIPCLFLAILCYVAIFVFVCKSGQKRRKLFHRPNGVDKSPINKLQLKVTRNLFITLCRFYIVLVVPYVLIYLVFDMEHLRPWAALGVTANSCVNPFIYGYGHPHFKEAFYSIFKCNAMEETVFWRRQLPPNQTVPQNQLAIE